MNSGAPQLAPHSARGPQPSAQVFLGATHAGGGIAGAGYCTHTFAIRIGGGLDLQASSAFAARLLQVDYFRTGFNNPANNRQSNLLR
jgi:hypothetical protein